MVIKKLLLHPRGRIGLFIVASIILIALLAPVIAKYDPYDILHRDKVKQPPSITHILGTDASGGDIFSKVIYGARVSLTIGLLTGISTTLLGALLGILAGYIGGAVDFIIMRLADVLLVIPTLPLMILLAAYFSPRFYMIIIIFTLFGWTGISRTIRSRVLSLKSQNYILAAKQFGAKSSYIIFKHIFPAISPLLIISGVLSSAGVMLAEAGLSFIGFGDPQAISWGKMLNEAQQNHGLLFRAWWWIIPPGLSIFITVIGFMQIGYALEEIFNPKIYKDRLSRKLFKKFVKNEKKNRRVQVGVNNV